jgi:CRISPR-associated protein Cmr5
MPNLAQRRAAHALDRVEELKKLKEKEKVSYGNYKSYAKALPANILMSGLGQAMATVRSRVGKRDGYGQLYDHLESWLCGNDADAPYQNFQASGNRSTLLHAITQHDQDTYIRAQAEALAYLEWLRKFAEAFLEDGDLENNDLEDDKVSI